MLISYKKKKKDNYLPPKELLIEQVKEAFQQQHKHAGGQIQLESLPQYKALET